MLGSITPLGERSRKGRWTRTMVLYIAASAAGGMVLGGALGTLGAAIAPSPAFRPWVLAAVMASGTLLEMAPWGLGLPSVRRQVNEAWLRRYRPWVYGVAFGFQLGTGVVTVVTASAVYAAFAAAFLTASPVAGAVIGAAFGAVRGAAILPAGSVRGPEQLGRIDRRLRRWDGPSKRIALACQLLLVAVCVAAAVA
jgi:hypothetical protein